MFNINFKRCSKRMSLFCFQKGEEVMKENKKMNVLERLAFELESAAKITGSATGCESEMFALGFIAGIQSQQEEKYCHLTDEDIEKLHAFGEKYYYKNFYFTFGSYEKFPYQNGYIIVKAEDVLGACKKFRGKFPDRTKGVMNCSDVYTETLWKKVCSKFYSDRKPFEVIE